LRLDGGVLVDSHKQYRIGEYYDLIDINYEEFQKVKGGSYSPTFLYKGPGDKFYKSVFIPLKNNKGKIFGILGLENTAGYLIIIKNLKNIIFLGELLALIFAIILGVIITQWITTPIDKMVHTAELLGKGHYKNRIEVNIKDELGILAHSLNEMADKIEGRDLQLKQLTAGVAHEVRNPLAGIKTSLDYLFKNINLNEDDMDILRGIENEVKSLSKFVNDFLAFSGKIVLEIDTVEINTIINSVLKMFREKIQAKELIFELQDKKEFIQGDKDKLRNVFANVILNAIQASEQGGKIKIEIRDRQNKIIISVMDNGIGLNEEKLDKVFEPFYTKKGKGTGLGLSITKKIIDAHKGKIYLRPNKPRGTICIIELNKKF
jgi:signal transduction histidine kinase